MEQELAFDELSVELRNSDLPTANENNQAYHISVMEDEITALEGELDHSKDCLKATDLVVEKQTAVIKKQDQFIIALEYRLQLATDLLKAQYAHSKHNGWQTKAYLNDAQARYSEQSNNKRNN